MNIKKIFINICISFTLITIISGIIELNKGITFTYYFDIFFRLILCTIAFSTMSIFDYLEHWPLRFVQLIHYLFSLSLVMIAIYLSHFIEIINPKLYVNVFISYSILYFIILIIYEIKLRHDIKKHNHLIKYINNK